MAGSESILQTPFVPFLENDFVPRRFLRGGHAQTFAGNFLPRTSQLPPPEDRLFRIADDVQILCHCHWQPARESQMTLVIVHGLEGSSQSKYVIGTSDRAWLRGWNVVRMNVRGCGGTEHLSGTLYHSGLSQDVEHIISQLIDEERLERVALAGFSMGGNQVLRAVGLWGNNAPRQLVAAAAVSPACDLSLSSDRIHEAAGSIYERWFLRSLRRSFRRKALLWPGKYDPSLLRHVRSVRDFDEHITSRYMGFGGAEDYYTQASSSRVVAQIAVPTLVIHAEDDPFVVIAPPTRAKLEANPHVRFLLTEHGGHCAFVADAAPGDDGRWAERKIIEFLSALDAPGAR